MVGLAKELRKAVPAWGLRTLAGLEVAGTSADPSVVHTSADPLAVRMLEASS